MSEEKGAYGFTISGLDTPGELLGPAEPHWPPLDVVRVVGEPEAAPEEPGTVRVSDHRAEIWIGDGGRVDVDRDAMTVSFRTAEPLADRLVVHPYLGLPASIASNWLGRQVLHGGGFARDGRGWALLGDKESGKSSTLGWLARHGAEILSDDILVIEDGELFAGPRCIDLRPEAAAVLGGKDVGMLGNRVRWRLRSGEACSSAPLCGVVHLEWGDAIRVEQVDAAERLTGLIAGSVIRPGSGDAAPFLDLAALPTFRFVRPRDLGALEASGERLLAALT
jgi:hypothetical protein